MGSPDEMAADVAASRAMSVEQATEVISRQWDEAARGMRAATRMVSALGVQMYRDRARLEALLLVASVIDEMGSETPAALIQAHRVLATGYTDEDRPVDTWPSRGDAL